MPKQTLTERLAASVAKQIESGNVTVQAIADRAGCSRQYLRMIVTGKRNPTLDLAARIAEAAGGSIKLERPRGKVNRKKGGNHS